MRTLITVENESRLDIRIQKSDPSIHFTVYDEERQYKYTFDRKKLLNSLSLLPRIKTMGVVGNVIELIIFSEETICQIRIKLSWKDLLGYEPKVSFRITLVADRNIFTIFQNDYLWPEFESDLLNDLLLFKETN